MLVARADPVLKARGDLLLEDDQCGKTSVFYIKPLQANVSDLKSQESDSIPNKERSRQACV